MEIKIVTKEAMAAKRDLLLRKLNIPEWMIYWAFYSMQKTSYAYLHVLLGMIPLKPGLKIKKLRVMIKTKLGHPRVGHIHIPKTGGTSTNSGMTKVMSYINFQHVVVRRNLSDRFCPVGLYAIREYETQSFFLFSNVRNPLTFLVSYYHHAGGFDPKYRNTNHYDYENAQRGFEYLVNVIMDRVDKWPSQKFLYLQLFDQEGSCVIDWINRTECLNDDIKRMSNYFGLSYIPKPPKRVSKKIKAYNEFYSTELLEMVCRNYYREIKIFGYKEFDLVDPLLGLKPIDRQRLRYNYATDELFIDGKLL